MPVSVCGYLMPSSNNDEARCFITKQIFYTEPEQWECGS